MSTQMIRPEKIYFEVTNHCNFNCDFCPSHESGRPRQHMDFALFEKGIDDIAREHITGHVGFHVLGEPLIYPRLIDAIRYSHSRGLDTSINTNGSLLTSEAGSQLIDAGLDHLNISLQTLGERDHECRGTALPYARYYDRVMGALRDIRSSGSEMEIVLCYMNTSTRRFFDIDKPMRVSWQADRARAALLFLVVDACAAAGQRVPREDVALAVQRLDLLRPKFVRIDPHTAVFVQPMMDWGNAFTRRRVFPAHAGYCGYCLSNLGILSNGEVTICCGDYDGATSLGNLRDRSLGEILSSYRAHAIADGMRRMRLVDPYCQRCFGSPNPIKAAVKGLGSIYFFKVLKFQPSGVREVPLLAATPEQSSSGPGALARLARSVRTRLNAAPTLERPAARSEIAGPASA